MSDERKISPNSFEALTSEEKAEAVRLELYATHKARGSLGTYYLLYPDQAPKFRKRESDGHERERER